MHKSLGWRIRLSTGTRSFDNTSHTEEMAFTPRGGRGGGDRGGRGGARGGRGGARGGGRGTHFALLDERCDELG